MGSLTGVLLGGSVRAPLALVPCFQVMRILSCCMGVGWNRGWAFLISNILYILFSNAGLKSCVYGQMAGEVCGSLSALEAGHGVCLIHFCPCLSWGQSLAPRPL